MSVRETGKANSRFPHALPCFSTETEDAARKIVATVCRLNYDGNYVLPDFDGTIESMSKLTERIENL